MQEHFVSKLGYNVYMSGILMKVISTNLTLRTGKKKL